MSTQTMAAGSRSLGRIYTLEAKSELLKLLRLPMYAVPTIAFPMVFYLLFGVAMGGRSAGGVSYATYLMVSYGAFGVVGASLFGFGVGLAVERGQGWMLFKRATPMPPLVHLAGRLTVCLLFSAAVVLGLFALGAALAGVRLPAAAWLTLVPVLLSGALAFGAFGLAIGYWVGPNSAPAVVNVIYLPVAFASGMWFPIQAMPRFVQELAPFLPSYHYTQLALKVIGADLGGAVATHVAALVGFTVVSLFLARAGFRRDEGRTFG
ncbi:MAG TPA: ABC transporter permease [Thermoanaerobaculia bacterium]|nr:ABC transporter permease [Thermoanaerobaculia bacterium]